MNVNNFENQIAAAILQRGKGYFQRGHVVNLFRVTDTGWQSAVEGTDLYVVDVELNEGGEILDSSCNCPFDSDSYCKHEVAVFYALREAFGNGIEQEKSTLQQLLHAKSKEELIQVILNLSSSNHQIYKQLQFEISVPEGEIEYAEAVILQHISNVKNRGFIEYNRVTEALGGVYLTLDRVSEKIEDKQFETAIQLSLLSLRHSVDLINYADDSSGEMGSVIDDSLGFVEEATELGIEEWNREEKQAVFAKIVEGALDKQFDDWSEWRFQLLRICIYFCVEPEFEGKLNEVLQSLLANATGDSWSEQYNNRRLKEIQYQLIAQNKDEKAIESFLLANLENHNMREKAILYLFNKKAYEKALKLSIEGEIVDEKLPGIVGKWKDYQYESYQYLGDEPAMRDIAFAKVLQGESDYYTKYKLLSSENEWQAVLSKLLMAFDKKAYYPTLYLVILVKENQKQRLLDYCQKYPSAILSYQKYLVDDYFVEVDTIFMDYIQREAQAASSRGGYKEVCNIIGHYQKACGQNGAVGLIEQLRVKYNRRPAFLDELNKVL